MPMPTPPTEQQNQTVLELIYAIKGLSQALETMHEDLRNLLGEHDRLQEKAHEKIRDLIQEQTRNIDSLPVATADRMEALISKRVDATLDETRRTLDDVRMKLWLYLGTPKGPDASGSGMTVRDGVPVPIKKEEDVTGQVTLMGDGKMEVRGRFNAGKIAKLLLVLKWVVASLAAAGGVAGIVKAILAIIHGV